MRPWWYPIFFVGVYVPYAVYDTSWTIDRIEQIDQRADQSREARCNDAIADSGLPYSTRQNLCRCIVAEAEQNGATRSFGGYDDAGFHASLRLCAEAYGIAVPPG